MLAVPVITNINSISIFGDDLLFYKYYPIAAAPRIRLDENGQPVCLLIKYAISDEDRLANKSLPGGGGYMNFDIIFDVKEADLVEVAKQLQPLVDKEWQRLKNGSAEDQARPGVANTTEPPKVEFGAPTWTAGNVALDAPQDNKLISARISEAEPSLLSGNIAVFSMDLTTAGATFMQNTLVVPDGTAIDLTPIQVRYQLKFWARLPSVSIHIRVDSEKIHTYLRKVMEGQGVDGCTTYDFEHTDLTDESIKVSSAIDVQIENAGALPDRVIEELRKYSLDLVKQMIQSNFFTDTPPARPAGADEDPADFMDGSNNSKKYFKREYNAAEMNIEFNLEQRSVVEWPIQPQATLQTFFQEMTPAQIKQHVRQISLEDDFFTNLQLTVRVFTDFSDSEVANVEVQVHYEGTDENGEAREKNQTFTFTDSEPQQWSVSLIGSQREYQYRYRVSFKGQEAGPFNAWSPPSKSPDLNISIPNPGKLDLTVRANDVDFGTVVEQIQVRLAYEDKDSGVPHEESVVVLDSGHQEEHYSRNIWKPQLKPIFYRTRFRMISGDVSEDPEWKEIEGPQLVLNQPFVNTLRVSLIPAGDAWEDVVTSVELKYEDLANHYTVQDSLSLKNRDEFKTWKVPLRNRNLTDFSYRWLTSYKNGHFEDSGWKTGIGTGTYPITVKRQGYRIVLLPDLLDLAASPITQVYLHYQASGVDRAETFKFNDKLPQTWNIDVPEGAPLDYTVQVTHFPISGDPIVLKETPEHDSVVVIPAYHLPIAGKIVVQVFPTLLDFSITPIVTVDLHYDDPLNNVHISGALTFTTKETQTWEFNVKDINQKSFTYQLCYYTNESEFSQPVKPQDTPRIVIPKYKPL